MIDLNSIPVDVQQFMVDTLCNNTLASVPLYIFIAIAFLFVACLHIIDMVKHKSRDSVYFICLSSLISIFCIICIISDISTANTYRDNPEYAMIKYISKAYNDKGYYNALYVRGVDIYGNYEG